MKSILFVAAVFAVTAAIAATADLAAALVFAGEIAAATPASVEDRHLAAEALQHDLGRVLFDAGLVGPFAGLELALDIDLRALAQILLGHPRQVLVVDHDLVPLGLLAALARTLVAPGFRGRDAQVDHRIAGGQPPRLGIAPEIADQNHLVHAARHRSLLACPLSGPTPLHHSGARDHGCATRARQPSKRISPLRFPGFHGCSMFYFCS